MSAGRLPGCRRGGPDRGRRGIPWLAPWWLLLAVGTAGCAGTPWGENLSGSFPPPREPVPNTPLPPGPGASASAPSPGAAVEPPLPSPPASPGPPAPGAAPPRAPVPGAKARGSPGLQTQGPKAPQPAPARAQPPSAPIASSPYRVTLRLPRADPSAPAEAVTQALRAAGISFEVETIERVSGGSASPSPAAGEGVPASPAVRPAPPPR